MRSLVSLILTALLSLLALSAFGHEYSDDSDPLIAPKPWKQILRGMTTDELFATLARVERARYALREYDEMLKLDLVLLEVQRRAELSDGDPITERLHEFVRNRARELDNLANLLYIDDGANLSSAEYDAAHDAIYYHETTFASMLTVLRRIQKKPDPVYLKVVGFLMKDEDEATSIKEWTVFEQPDRVRVQFINRDDEFETVFAYASACTSHWRLYAANESPNGPPPLVPHPTSFFESCSEGSIELSRGEDKYFVDEEQQIDEFQNVYLNDFAIFSAPGTYRLQVQTHPRESLDDNPYLQNIVDTVCISSSVFTLVLNPTQIEVTCAEIAEVVALVDQIDAAQPVFLMSPWYADDHLKYIPPDSAAGKIIAKEFKAIPGLLQVLERKCLTPELRSWVLGLLYNVLRNVDSVPAIDANPQDSETWDINDVLPYRYRISSAHYRTATYKLVRSTVDERKQKQLAEEWIQYLKRNTKITITSVDQ